MRRARFLATTQKFISTEKWNPSCGANITINSTKRPLHPTDTSCGFKTIIESVNSVAFTAETAFTYNTT